MRRWMQGQGKIGKRLSLSYLARHMKVKIRGQVVVVGLQSNYEPPRNLRRRIDSEPSRKKPRGFEEGFHRWKSALHGRSGYSPSLRNARRLAVHERATRHYFYKRLQVWWNSSAEHCLLRTAKPCILQTSPLSKHFGMDLKITPKTQFAKSACMEK